MIGRGSDGDGGAGKVLVLRWSAYGERLRVSSSRCSCCMCSWCCADAAPASGCPCCHAAAFPVLRRLLLLLLLLPPGTGNTLGKSPASHDPLKDFVSSFKAALSCLWLIANHAVC